MRVVEVTVRESRPTPSSRRLEAAGGRGEGPVHLPQAIDELPRLVRLCLVFTLSDDCLSTICLYRRLQSGRYIAKPEQ